MFVMPLSRSFVSYLTEVYLGSQIACSWLPQHWTGLVLRARGRNHGMTTEGEVARGRLRCMTEEAAHDQLHCMMAVGGAVHDQVRCMVTELDGALRTDYYRGSHRSSTQQCWEVGVAGRFQAAALGSLAVRWEAGRSSRNVPRVEAKV